MIKYLTMALLALVMILGFNVSPSQAYTDAECWEFVGTMVNEGTETMEVYKSLDVPKILYVDSETYIKIRLDIFKKEGIADQLIAEYGDKTAMMIMIDLIDKSPALINVETHQIIVELQSDQCHEDYQVVGMMVVYLQFKMHKLEDLRKPGIAQNIMAVAWLIQEAFYERMCGTDT